MKLKENTKSPYTDTAGRTQSYQYDNPNGSPQESVSFRQSPSPSRHNTFTHTRDQALHSYEHHSNIQSYLQPYSTLSNSPPRGLRSYLAEDLDQQLMQKRIQLETLYIQLGKMRQQLQLSEDLRAIQAKNIQQQYEEIMSKQSSQLRQTFQNQIQVYELQIRKIKEQLNDKNDEVKRLNELLQRQKQSKEIQKNRFNDQVRLILQKKNAQVIQQKQERLIKLRDFEQSKKSQVQELRYNFNKEIRNLNKMLQQRQEDIERIRLATERQQRQKMKQIESLQGQHEAIQKRNELRLSQEYQKYDNIRIKFNQLILQFSEIGQKSRAELHSLFQTQYNQLFVILKEKQNENQQIKKQKKLQVQIYQAQLSAIKEQNYLLQKKINENARINAQDMQILKVKLAALHHTDVTQLKQLYELKLKNLSGNLYRMDEQNSKLRQMTNLLSAQKYEQKKVFQITISQLNSRILKMRMGMSNMESDYRQKMQNQKSLMLMTSRSFLKQAEAKNIKQKFLEEEIRKIRQLMDLQSRENQNSQKVVQQRIQAANYELQQLSNRVLSIAKEKKQLEEQMNELRREKDEEISRLRSQINVFEVKQTGQIPQLKIIQQQRELISKQKQEIGILKDKVYSQESRMKQMKEVGERLQLQNNIHMDQAKKQFHIIADQHLKDFKNYYQEKLKVVEEQKSQLKKIISSQTQKITQLIKKYKQTEEGLKEATRLMKKRTQLQEKVMNIGLDVNLVKNLSELLPVPKSL